MDHGKIVRIGGASGFWGDSMVAAPQLVRSGQIDYLVFDFLAETTMAILAGARAKAPELGYATDFVDVAMKSVLADVAERGIKVISNAGGINPRACAAALAALAHEAGVSLRIAVVEGDDVAAQLPALRAAGRRDLFSGDALPERVLSANAYLGALPIVRALAAGADVVITGRCVDSAVTLAPLIHEFGWNVDDYDRLAAGSLAGHIIECGCQATGGLHTDWEAVPDWPSIGYPIVECAADGSFVVTKPRGTGGLIARAAVAEQLVYEIGDPGAYVLPDVTCDLRDVRIEQIDPERVRVTGARGLPPPATYKVSATAMDGWRCAGSLVVIGIDAAAKARRTGEAILARVRAIFATLGIPDFRATHIEMLGSEAMYGAHARSTSREVMLRVVADHARRDALELFAREIAPAVTSWAPGSTSPAGGRPSVSPVIRQFAFALEKNAVVATFEFDGQRHGVEIPVGGGSGVPQALAGEPPPFEDTGEAMVDVPLVKLAWARSGDKGDLSNIGVIARQKEWMPLIWREVTPEKVRAYFAHLVRGDVERWYLPGIDAMNLVLHGALDGGGPASHRMDPLGKAMAQMLLDLPVAVPRSLAQML
ncbi:MAG TPA: acyclic terpene utilization AtuA family protein [Tahibacter sp.]|nr:acyclic terpene utilization AtuA family protein [Tahibacter sp.]